MIITGNKIRLLRTAAGVVGDFEQVATCNRALNGDEEAIAECTRVIEEWAAEAAADDDDDDE